MDDVCVAAFPLGPHTLLVEDNGHSATDSSALSKGTFAVSCSRGINAVHHLPGVPRRRDSGRPPKRGPQSAIQLPWKPSGTRTGRWTVAMGSPVKSCAERITRSAAPRSGLLT